MCFTTHKHCMLAPQCGSTLVAIEWRFSEPGDRLMWNDQLELISTKAFRITKQLKHLCLPTTCSMLTLRCLTVNPCHLWFQDLLASRPECTMTLCSIGRLHQQLTHSQLILYSCMRWCRCS